MKKQTSTLKSFMDVDEQLLELASFETLIQREEAAMNEKIQKTRDEYDERTRRAREQKAAIERNIEMFCIENKDEFEKTRTRDLVHGSIGFRMTTPKVALLNKKYNWGTVFELAKRVFGKKYIRVSEELDKEAILADVASSDLSDEKLASIGAKVDQTDRFTYGIKWDSINAD